MPGAPEPVRRSLPSASMCDRPPGFWANSRAWNSPSAAPRTLKCRPHVKRSVKEAQAGLRGYSHELGQILSVECPRGFLCTDSRMMWFNFAWAAPRV